MIAFVFFVINFSTEVGSRFAVFLSISAKTGTAFAKTTAVAVAMKVYEGKITSSPASIPAAFKHIHIADVPE